MTFRQTFRFWIIFLALLAYYVACEREVPEPVHLEVRQEKILPMFIDEAKAITVTGSGREIRAERYGKRWKVVDPEGVVVPSDLVAALLSALAEKREAALLTESPTKSELAAFGLEDPRLEIRVEEKNGESRTVLLGEQNPAGTAIYARTNHSQRVFLLGLSVQLYGDLLLEATGSQ